VVDVDLGGQLLSRDSLGLTGPPVSHQSSSRQYTTPIPVEEVCDVTFCVRYL